MVDAAYEGRTLAAVVVASGSLCEPIWSAADAAIDAGFLGTAEIKRAGGSFPESPLSYNQGDRRGADQIIMCSAFCIIAVSTACGLVSLESGYLFFQHWEGFDVWRIVESFVLHQTPKISNDERL